VPSVVRIEQVDTQLDLRRAASPGCLHLHGITADDVAAILGDQTPGRPVNRPTLVLRAMQTG